MKLARWRGWLGQWGWASAGIVLFLLSLALMKEGAHGLEPLLRNDLDVTNAADSLGFGWLMSGLILSGSPVAVIAVTLLSVDALQPVQALTMITGSRVGASLVVLLLGLLYALREHERWSALTAGVLSLLISGSAQALALPIGLALLGWDWFDHLSLSFAVAPLGGLADWLDPLVNLLGARLPDWLLFVVGVGVVMLGFRCIDRALPQIHLEKTDLSLIPRLVYRPEIMFLIGLAVTALTMSVSVSVGILVPLSARGYVRRENIIPYILGANISTLVDTLVAAALLGDPRGVTVVLAQMMSIALVSLPIVLLFYRAYERLVSRALRWVTHSRRNLAIFLGTSLIVPLLLVLL